MTSGCEGVLTELSATSLPAVTASLPPEPADLPLLGCSSGPSHWPFLSPTRGQEGPQDKTKKHRSQRFLKHLESLRRKEKGGGRQADLEHSSVTSEKVAKASSFRSLHGFLYRAKNRAATSASGSDAETQRAWKKAWPVAMFQHPQRAHWGDCLVHVPRDHKPGTFPRSLSIESLCPEDGHRLADWQPGRHWGYEGRRGSCGSTGSHTSIYDNMPELYPAEPVLAGAEAEEEEEEGGGSYTHLDDILQHVWGLQQRVELWSQAMCPDLEPGDKEEEEEEEAEEEATSTVEIATDGVEGQTSEARTQGEAPALRESLALGHMDVQLGVLAQPQTPAKAEFLAQIEAGTPGFAQDHEEETHSGGEPTSSSSLSVEEGHVSDTVASSSELDSSGNSMNEAEATGSPTGLQTSVPRERRDSGVGASLTRPCRWEFRVRVGQGFCCLSLSPFSLSLPLLSSLPLPLCSPPFLIPPPYPPFLLPIF